jgi:putative cell wall-binding protein
LPTHAWGRRYRPHACFLHVLNPGGTRFQKARAMTRTRLALPAVLAAALLTGGAAATTASAAVPSATTITKARLAGADRYKTAVAISRANFVAPQEWVVVSSGQNFPDALAAGPMAAFLEAPLLLVPTSGTLPSAVATEIKRLQTKSIMVVGGPAAVSDGMVDQLAKLVTDPANNIAFSDGPNRYATAASTSDGFQPPVVNVPVYIASGTTFADALGGGAAASLAGGTMLLTTPTRLPSETAAALRRLKPSKVIVLGGTAAVSSAVLSQVKGVVGSAVPVTRVGGSDRFATAARLSAATMGSAKEVFLANGLNYPDALAGGPVAPYFGGRPLLLTKKDCVPSSTLAEIKRLGATKVTALGGTGAVSDAALSLKPC